VRRQHADYYLSFAEQTAQEFKGRDQVEWVERLERENDNLRAGLEWAVETREAALGLRLAGALWRFWYARGYLSEGREWLARLFALAEKVFYTPEYATAVYGAVLLMNAVAFSILALLLIRHEGPESPLAKAFGRDYKGKLSLVFYIVAILAAPFLPVVSLALYVTVAAIWFLPDRRIERVLGVGESA